MTVTDPDWIACFGTDSEQIEKPVKQKKQRLDKGQQEAELILARPELFGIKDAKPVKPKSLFDMEPE